MPELIPGPVQIPVPGGKTIEEYIGHLASGDDAISIAHMIAPAGWAEPGQTPEFDEFTIVLDGAVLVEAEDGPTLVRAGQAVITRAGEWVRYSAPEGARYLAVCLPAFDLESAHRDPEDDDDDLMS